MKCGTYLIIVIIVACIVFISCWKVSFGNGDKGTAYKEDNKNPLHPKNIGLNPDEISEDFEDQLHLGERTGLNYRIDEGLGMSLLKYSEKLPTKQIKDEITSRPVSKSDHNEIDLDTDYNLFASKLQNSGTESNDEPILKSLQNSVCMRELKESNNCEPSRPKRPPSYNSVADEYKNKPRPIHYQLKNRPRPIVQSKDSVDDGKNKPLGDESIIAVKYSMDQTDVDIDLIEGTHSGKRKNKYSLNTKPEEATSPIGLVDPDSHNFDDRPGEDPVLFHGRSSKEVGTDDSFSVGPIDLQLELPDCSGTRNKRLSVLVISSLDGQITGINYNNGEVMWSYQTGGATDSLLSSSMSKIEVTSRGEWVRLIPSLDGGIYRFDGESVEALPVTADSLLHSSFKFNDDTIFTGGKVSEIIGISPFTGEVKYVCNSRGCPQQHTADTSNEVLVVRRVSQTVRAIDPKTGTERWNFSVGQHDVNIAKGGCDSVYNNLESDRNSLPSLKFVIPEGLIVGVSEDAQMLWKQKLPSPVVSAWSLVGDKLEQINLFSGDSIPALLPEEQASDHERSSNRQPSLYVGIHRKQLYIQQNKKFQSEVGSVIQQLPAGTYGEEALPKVYWQPYLATALSRTPVIHNSGKHHNPMLLDYDRKQYTSDLVVKHRVDYPYDNGYYLFGNEESVVLNDSDHWQHYDNDDDDDEMYAESSIADQIYYICFQYGPNTWWKLLTGFLMYCICHVMFIRYFISVVVGRIRRANQERALAFIRLTLLHIFRENPQVLRVIQRLGITVPQLPLPAPPPESGLNTPVTPSSTSGESYQTVRQDSNFSSRYTSDFEPVCCLGKGGFGVVFQVKNKLDENEYAIKRIILPTKETSAERVKREVRALARLNHTNIVRYYNSWLETPPPGWEEEADVWWKNGEVISSSYVSPDADVEETAERLSLPQKHNEAPSGSNSLSGVINKLNQRDFNIQNVNIASFSKPDSIKCSDIDDSDNDSVTGYDEDDEENSDDDDDDNCASHYSAVDKSFSSSFKKFNAVHNKNNAADTTEDDSVVFETSSLATEEFIIFKEDSLATQNDLGHSKDDSIVFQNESHHSKDDSKVLGMLSHEIEVDAVTKSDYNKLTCATLETSRNESQFGNYSKGCCVSGCCSRRSCSFSRSGRVKVLKRRRVKSHGPLVSSERPSSLPLHSAASDPGGLNRTTEGIKLVQKIARDQSSPKPRTYLYIQMELCNKESLKDWLFANMNRDYSRIISIFNDIVLAVEYIHDRSLMHRDLKPSNIFFSLDGEIKVGDFGLVTTIEEEIIAVTPVDGLLPDTSKLPGVLTAMQRTVNAGTHLYMSPEQMSGKMYNYKIDIFSLGLIFFEMLVPFSTEMERRSVMLEARDMKFPQGFEQKFPDETALLLLALHSNPSLRPTTRGIRARSPLNNLQKDLESISKEDHFNLPRQKSHSRSYSGSFSGIFSSSVSST